VAKSSEYAWDAHLKKNVWQFGVPTGPKAMYQVAWWSDGPRAGEHKDGQIPILLGHTQIGGYGVFNNIGNLKPGQVLTLTAKDPQKVQRYKVLQMPIDHISKDDASALLNVLQHAPKEADLATITCSGSVDASIQSHKDNTVVFFALVGAQGK
jgi:asparagine synthetase B (glutamine-hydrolysing)